MTGADAWGGLLASPLPWMAATVGAFLLALEVHRRSGGHALTQPVALAVALLIGMLVVTGVPVQTYTQGTAPLRFLLGPATVALAVPMYEQRRLIARTWLPIGVALLAGCVTAVVSVVGLAWATGLSGTMMLSLSPKSATMPIAMEVSAKIGGLSTLTMVFVMATGLVGTALAGPLRRLAPGDDGRGMGFTLGLAAHGIGIGRAFQISPAAGVFAGLAMALNGIATAVLTPLILTLLRI
ncbi:putative effector of murein hydrolase [Azospirillum fermentarium]|uniref:LrgB family protein n=1 Tax=Azospirillum fermentarium TaxID=1233114 RepID=UPI0022277D5C|nr:LrgB family protein [Azospirillum fermentarium]MCW2248551.1 putative effector of murein hydrolase [Azospirillum fermentarium]